MKMKRTTDRPLAELLTLGTELVTGSVLNTNAQYLGRGLTQLGFRVHSQVACPDEPALIQGALARALKRSTVIFITGGLGPTPDDLTREAVAEFFQVPLVFSRRQYRQIVRYYRRNGRRIPALVKREAYFPANARPIFNQFGIALGFLIETNRRTVIVLPGVPGELERLFETRIKTYLQKKFPGLVPSFPLVVKTVGLSEPAVMRRLGKAFFKLGDFQFGIYPAVGEVSLRIYAETGRLKKRLKGWIARVLGPDIYSFSGESLEQAVGRILKKKRMTVSVAESCTGGRIAASITRVPGASRYFEGGMVAYQDRMKIECLGVRKQLIQAKGAVCRQTALAMSRGVQRQLGSDLGVAVTGIAGPGGGSARKPVGLVYFAISSALESQSWEVRFTGDRLHVQGKAARKALEFLWRWIKK